MIRIELIFLYYLRYRSNFTFLYTQTSSFSITINWKAILTPLNCLCKFVKDLLSFSVWVYYSCSIGCIALVPLELHSTVSKVQKSWNHVLSVCQLYIFLKFFWVCMLGSLHFNMTFRISVIIFTKKKKKKPARILIILGRIYWSIWREFTPWQYWVILPMSTVYPSINLDVFKIYLKNVFSIYGIGFAHISSNLHLRISYTVML